MLLYRNRLLRKPVCIDREQGYRVALQKSNARFNPALTAVGDFSIESGERAIELLLALQQRFIAVVCASHEMATR